MPLPVRDFVAALSGRPASVWVVNAPVQVIGAMVGKDLVPVTVTAPQEGPLSWVASLRSAYGSYALSELGHVPRAVRPVLAALVRGMDMGLSAVALDKLLCINNWLLSTNLHPNMGAGDLTEAALRLTAAYPEHFIAVRSLNDHHHGTLLEALREAGWFLLPARRVWIAEPATRLSRDRKADRRLLEKTSLTLVDGAAFTAEDWRRTADLYAKLYVEKYSPLNPVFSANFLSWAQGSGLMHVQGLRAADGQLMSVVGTIATHGVMTTPLVGYDTSLPKRLGLYRMAMALAFEDMDRRQLSYNVSAGVGRFKRKRGARAAIEFTALHDRHLPLWRRLPLRCLRSVLAGVGIPLMRRYDL